MDVEQQVKKIICEQLSVEESEVTRDVSFVEALGAEFVIPAHGVVGTTADVSAHRHYLDELHDAVAEGIAAGSSLEELQASVTMDAYSEWLNFEQWRPLNVEGMYNFLSQ